TVRLTLQIYCMLHFLIKCSVLSTLYRILLLVNTYFQINQLICFNCVIDGGHAQHAVKYDDKMEKIRKDLREEITVICSKVDDNKKTTLDKADQMTNLCAVIKKNLTEAEIPQQVLSQLDNIRS
ncbi:hypothetical protein PMAYCL1PPCAC_09594, partial [Pristionchus mayeri]